MKELNITRILENTLKNVESHKLAPGKYARKIKLPGMGEDNYGINAYGCADALNILYTLNRMPQDAEERKAFAEALQSMQEKDTGYFREGSHHIIHTTAHCTAALELLDARPIYPFYEMQKYKDFSEFEKYMAEYDWLRCGKAAHAGAGIYASLSIVGDVDAAWKRKYFDYFNSNCDAKTGLFVKEPAADFYTVRYIRPRQNKRGLGIKELSVLLVRRGKVYRHLKYHTPYRFWCSWKSTAFRPIS